MAKKSYFGNRISRHVLTAFSATDQEKEIRSFVRSRVW